MSYELEFRLDDWTILKNIFININEIIDEVVVECTSDGLRFKGIDRGHVCFFEGNISKELFDEYALEDVFHLYIDLNELVKVLKRGNKKDNLIFKANIETIKLSFKNKNNRNFSITQIDMNDNMRDIPQLNYTINFQCEFDTIKDSLKDADLYSDRLTFTCENNSLTLLCDGTNGNYENECELLESVEESCSATYSISWLFKIFNNKLSSENLIIHMGNDYPMLIEMNLDFIKVNYLLAPRLEND